MVAAVKELALDDFFHMDPFGLGGRLGGTLPGLETGAALVFFICPISGRISTNDGMST